MVMMLTLGDDLVLMAMIGDDGDNDHVDGDDNDDNVAVCSFKSPKTERSIAIFSTFCF